MEINVENLLGYSLLNVGGNQIGGIKEIPKGNWKIRTGLSLCKNEIIEGIISCVWAKSIG